MTVDAEENLKKFLLCISGFGGETLVEEERYGDIEGAKNLATKCAAFIRASVRVQFLLGFLVTRRVKKSSYVPTQTIIIIMSQ
jgi:hypothetical protein